MIIQTNEKQGMYVEDKYLNVYLGMIGDSEETYKYEQVQISKFLAKEAVIAMTAKLVKAHIGNSSEPRETVKELLLLKGVEATEDAISAELRSYSEYTKSKVSESIGTATVTTSTGKEFDANLEARQNLADAILANSYIGVAETVWRLADNTEATVTIEELKEAHLLALQKYAYLKGIA